MAIDTEDKATVHIFNKRQAGYKQVTAWLSEQSQQAVIILKAAEEVSRDEAINELILAGLKATRPWLFDPDADTNTNTKPRD